MNITVLALDSVFDTGLSAVLDAFTTANELAPMLEAPQPVFNVTLAGIRPAVRSAQGMQLPVVPLAYAPAPDLLILPAIGHKMPEPLQAALASAEVAEAGAVLRRQAGQGVRIAAACIGTFVLAESGLLDGEEATTTWWLTPMFRQRYPKVRLDAQRMVVASGRFITAGAALSHLDMSLALIRQASPELAAMVARYLVVDARPAQSAYVISDHLAHADPLVAGFDRWVRQHLAEGFQLEAAAAALATSKRTLARRLQEVLGKTPVNYVQDLRIERAVHLLKTSDQNVDRIAEQVGYRDGVTLRTLLRRKLGKGLRDIRVTARSA
ncbi:Transcriptional regulator GlxA family, contains an amidase domain and an AraC-type DNA-binding HTH domain [Duganella sp. CF458]|uniref:GlxA family transcriptional regulator n=1 Tax=Duganella sp. CF458 TaxID=1884368 RepID=UPI0008DFEC31|nr:helix-turn-helix domain-containing protein [Duganella sp. CF458]SFG45458.1 Transcriptional regulator GlxA family, contains an amidase domain and an AraC-type DNA-binding HTH domain [Duganella sp. CF458]